MTRRALVTGAAGFVGQHVARRLIRDGWEVNGASVSAPVPGILTAAERAAVRWETADLREPGRFATLLDTAAPEAILHLAGIAHVVAAQGDPGAAYEVNIVVAGRLLSEVRARRAAGTLDPVVLVIGSGEQYGRHDPSAMPLDEDTPQRPVTVYAATKAAQEVVALEAHRAAGVRVVCTRSFNHSGVGQHGDFLLPSLVRRVLELVRTGERRLRLGNTTSVRDYLHVDDVAAAYVALLARGVPGDAYNVASGQGTDVATLARRICVRAGVDAEPWTDPALVRPVDVPALVGDSARLRSATGWAPAKTIDDILDDLIHAASH